MNAPTRGRLTGSFWPSDLQKGLLIAALGNPDDALVAWQHLQPDFVLDELEPGSFDLMALIYRQLSSSGYHDSVVERLKGIYRREWVRANLLVEQTKEIAMTLREADVRALFIEGAALADRYYPELGLRPSWWVDVFVEERTASAALAALATAGWSTTPSTANTSASDRWALLNSDRSVCVLRTSLSYDVVLRENPARSHDPLWETAEPYDLGGTEILVPGPLGALLAVCVSGARLQPTANVQWIVDAVMILRKEEIDFARLVEVGTSRGQTLRLRDTFTYLSTLPEVRIPEDAFVKLDSARVTPRDRLAFALAAGSIRSAGSLPELVAKHLAATAHKSLPGAVASFPRYLRGQWGVSHSWELPYAAGRRAARLLRVPRRSA